MGEYVKYGEDIVKIGTCENIYYATYAKYCAALESNRLSKVDGNLTPELYAKPDSGFRFRFPFPDEDKLPFGANQKNFDRGVPIKLDSAIVEPPEKCNVRDGIFQMEIVQQKLVHRQSDNNLCLALVWRTHARGEYSRVENDDDVKNILSQIIKHHILDNKNTEQRSFYRSIAARILKGYRINTSQSLQRKIRDRPLTILSYDASAKRKI
ncbi:MAG: hypothetical protein M9904_14490 [Chitinophagaceae bacterium]|nr:hypothetical protein [Chitinophagaceae bacterium]MCO5241255.1 hypothetical protein [Chitinophagaceae bacterium]